MKVVFKVFLALLMILTIPAAALSTQVATITVDGDPSDWASILPAYIDLKRDTKCKNKETDLKSIYTAMDQYYVYIMVETYAKSFGDSVVLELDFQYDFQNIHTNIDSIRGLSAWVNGEYFEISGADWAWGQVMEAKIPLSELGNPSNFDPTKMNSWNLNAISASSDVENIPCDLTFTNSIRAAVVFSQVSEYDQDDFPGLSPSVVIVPVAITVADPPSFKHMSVAVTGIGTYEMDYQEGWKMFWATESELLPVSKWATTYLFENESDYRVLDLTGAQFRTLEVPNVSISGRTISWDRISTDTETNDLSTYYEVWLLGLNENGYPDHVAGTLFQSGLMTGISYTLPETISDGEYAVRVNTREYIEKDRELRWWEWFNRSCFYKKISIGVIQDPPEIDALIEAIEGLGLPKSIENSYMANLKKVKGFIDNGQTTAAINQMKAFIKKVKKDISKNNIGSGEGDNLIRIANQLISALG